MAKEGPGAWLLSWNSDTFFVGVEIPGLDLLKRFFGPTSSLFTKSLTINLNNLNLRIVVLVGVGPGSSDMPASMLPSQHLIYMNITYCTDLNGFFKIVWAKLNVFE
jgi:hypothetical protein